MRVRVKSGAAALAAALAVPAVVIGPAAPAHAVPADCTTQVTVSQYKPNIPKTSVTVRCASGTGQYRAVVKCIRYVPPNLWVNSTLYGPWATAGPNTSSTTGCLGTYLSTAVEFA
ncbi:hypothetical protein ABGB12_22555 [Actinocorallia sp. B10E7]|uniref:hypothetical protein n=1 Tax=Actinocorallia sp. B10E7 TaxID=3153558 RepID=UPI00325E638B